jgi:hypothetical protein
MKCAYVAERARQIEAAKSQCPDTKMIASGYSQGCQIVHNAVSELEATTASWINSVLLFGDPSMQNLCIILQSRFSANKKQWMGRLLRMFQPLEYSRHAILATISATMEF